MQKYVKNEKRYRLINFICLLAVYKKLIGTGRALSTRILRYACLRNECILHRHVCVMSVYYIGMFS